MAEKKKLIVGSNSNNFRSNEVKINTIKIHFTINTNIQVLVQLLNNIRIFPRVQ